MTGEPSSGAKRRRAVAEAITAGLAFGSFLWWTSTCIVGSFRPQQLAAPFWSGFPWLRTDTSGFAAFVVAAVCLATTRYLRLWRQRASARTSTNPATARLVAGAVSSTASIITLAVSEAVAVMATGLASYLSLNQVTHPSTLQIRATHFLSWPTEGTLRMAALLLCVCSVSVIRYLQVREWSLRTSLTPQLAEARELEKPSVASGRDL
jgi:hypothetical protein